MIVEYADLKLDLRTALSLLEHRLTDADAWEMAMLIEMDHCEPALRRLRELAIALNAAEASEFVTEIAQRARLSP